MARKKSVQLIKPMIYLFISGAMMAVLFTSYRSVVQRRDDIAALEKQKEQLLQEKEALQNEVDLLNDSDYVTRYARENYVFTREGEQVVILPELDDKK